MESKPSALILPDICQRQIIVHTAAAHPEECCGLLIGRQMNSAYSGIQVDRIISANNSVSELERKTAYAIDPLFLLRQEKLVASDGKMILGFYHSHPESPAIPSITDLQKAWPVYVYVIVSTVSGVMDKMTAWILDSSSQAFYKIPICM